MNARAHAFHPRHIRPLPVVLIDNNVLLNLFQLEQLVARDGIDVDVTPSEMLESLCDNGKATLIIPRSVFNEATQWDIRDTNGFGDFTRIEGYLDLPATGEPDLCVEQMNWPASRNFVEWLGDMQELGRVRTYRSLGECYAKQEELIQARGGVILLDSKLVRGMRTADTEEVVTASISTTDIKSKHTVEQLQPATKGRSFGDSELAALARTIAAYSRDKQRPPRYLLLSNDIDAKKAVSGATERAVDTNPNEGPLQINTLQLLTALQRGGMLSRRDFETYFRLCTKQLEMNGRQTVSDNFRSKVAQAHTWLAERSIVEGTAAAPVR